MILERLIAEFGDDRLSMSAVADEALFRSVLDDLIAATGPIGTIVETGTFRGWASALLSEYADRVVTFDVQDHPGRADAWALLGVSDTIDFRLIANDREKAAALAGIDFDAAFVDGCHIGGVAVDFELLRPCGRLVFHDYAPGFPPGDLRTHVVEFVDTIGRRCPAIVDRRPPFATWVDETAR